ncbi:MAG: protein translocase subunit SecF [Ruminococcus sp.]|nr:protein translocase subunit SecF [Ruminococcus sp.]
MRKVKKPVFFIVVAVIAVLTYLTIFGVHGQYGDTEITYIKGVDEIRWGIDIQGGVNATFEPADDYDASEDDMAAAKSLIEQRLVKNNITDSEVYVDENEKRVVVEFPWQAGDTDFDPETAIEELGESAILTFREGSQDPDGTIILTGDQVTKAEAGYQTDETTGSSEVVVSLEFDDEGTEAFAEATAELAGSGSISIYMDDECISYPTVNSAITDGKCVIEGDFTYDEAKKLADNINAGSLPFKLEATSTSIVSPTLGEGALTSIVIAGIIAFVLIAIYMIFIYRLAGVVATISLIGQVICTIAAISGFFSNISSFTLTIPGIAGIILAVGMGIDANVVTFERVKEELGNGKTLNGAIESGFKKAWSAVFDSNITVVFVAIILMGAFGPTDGLFAKLLNFVFFSFGASTAGTIYSLGYTLLVGIILNFVFGILASRLMLSALSKFKCFKKPSLYGYKEKTKERKTLNVYGKRKIFYTISVVIIVAALAYTALGVVSPIGGVDLAIEFKGGTLIEYSYEGEIDTDAVADVVKESIGEEVTVKTGESMANDTKTVTLSFASGDGLTNSVQTELTTALQEEFTDNNLEVYSSSDVSPSNGKEFFLKCFVAVAFAAIVMIIYIGFRFRKIGGISAGCMAVVALLHDALMVFACFAFCGFDIDDNFMAVILTILGYSINATIIIYDRIRENKRLYGKKTPLVDLVNMSVTQTFGRTIHTNVTTVISMLTVCIVCLVTGVTSILPFVFPIIIGMLAGVYSSNVIAPTLWVTLQNKRAAKEAKQKAKA